MTSTLLNIYASISRCIHFSALHQGTPPCKVDNEDSRAALSTDWQLHLLQSPLRQDM